jgi:hypothetical protein
MLRHYSAPFNELHSGDRETFFLRKTLILRPPVWTPRINIMINPSKMVTTAANGRIGTYRKNVPRLPRVSTPRRTPREVVM